MTFVQLDVYSTNRKFFIFQMMPPNLETARLHLSLGLASCPASGGILSPMATSLGERASSGMFVLRPHAAFSFRPQPINTESAPKNVVDSVSDSRPRGGG